MDGHDADSEATSEIFRGLGLLSESSDGGGEEPAQSRADFSSEAESDARKFMLRVWKPSHFHVIWDNMDMLSRRLDGDKKSFRCVSFARARVHTVWLADETKSQKL